MDKPIMTGLYITDSDRYDFLFELYWACHSPKLEAVKEWAERALDNPKEDFILEISGKED